MIDQTLTCDRCGRTTNSTRRGAQDSQHSSGPPHWGVLAWVWYAPEGEPIIGEPADYAADLCPQCANSFPEWVKEQE